MSSIRCYYEILDVARDADEKTIKKGHRKKALKYHPDKNYGDEEAEEEFRLVQEAYECLSDPAERRWYDEHREMILNGGQVGGEGGDGGGEADISFMYDVTPFHFSGCYDGYGDGPDGFFAVYQQVFENIMEGERDGWISEGNIDETLMPNAYLNTATHFGQGDSSWKDELSQFYSAWENFSSCLSFAWADKYDPRDAECRRVRRRIDDENRKARRIAKKERNQDIIHLVTFVKKRDPRVKAARKRLQEEKLSREREQKEKALQRKADIALAKETWLQEREEEMKNAELDDLNAGRIRLADLDDSDDDYFYYGKKKKGKKKQKKKGKKQSQKSKTESDEDDGLDEHDDDDVRASIDAENDIDIGSHDELGGMGNDFGNDHDNIEEESLQNMTNTENEEERDFYDSEEEEEEPEIFKCEICRKTFKSKAQLENHFKSKKHKEAVKKLEKQQKQQKKR